MGLHCKRRLGGDTSSCSVHLNSGRLRVQCLDRICLRTVASTALPAREPRSGSLYYSPPAGRRRTLRTCGNPRCGNHREKRGILCQFSQWSVLHKYQANPLAEQNSPFVVFDHSVSSFAQELPAASPIGRRFWRADNARRNIYSCAKPSIDSSLRADAAIPTHDHLVDDTLVATLVTPIRTLEPIAERFCGLVALTAPAPERSLEPRARALICHEAATTIRLLHGQ